MKQRLHLLMEGAMVSGYTEFSGFHSSLSIYSTKCQQSLTFLSLPCGTLNRSSDVF